MTIGQQIRHSYRELQQRWTDMADAVFGKATPALDDEMARGEFISPLISQQAPVLSPNGRNTPRG